jgi:oxygen-independent coproporphyrinogen-3 oxidase
MGMSEIDPFRVSLGEQEIQVPLALLDKYDRPGPRYTSYPTAPEWDDRYGPDDFRAGISASATGSSAAPLSLYFHIPFCRSLCLYCGCNVFITKNHEVTTPYLAHIKQEIDWVADCIPAGRSVKQLHWGGGTPTYLETDEIRELYRCILSKFDLAPDAEIGIEIDPRATTPEQCAVLRELGFNRLSLGIQDFDPKVQKAVHRIQSYEMTREIFDGCRNLGFESINVDLIFGLPHQTIESFTDTVDKIVQMRPDRIALFSYAHVPWLKKQQGSFARHLPERLEKFGIFCLASRKFSEAGYRYIGMDHFALPADELVSAQRDRSLHRNFQGYTTKGGCDLYGFGVSAISALDDAYAQNWRDLPSYYKSIDEQQWPTMRGVRVSPVDQLRRVVINRLLCNLVLIKSEVEQDFSLQFDEYFEDEMNTLVELERDQLVRLSQDRIEVTELGRIFVRNVAMVFDSYLKQPGTNPAKRFSKTL